MQTDLEKNALEVRPVMIDKNEFDETVFYDVDSAQQANGGKGTNGGSSMGHLPNEKGDIYNGGSDADINGVSHISFSGRIANVGINTYSKDYDYNDDVQIDMSLNKGIVIHH